MHVLGKHYHKPEHSSSSYVCTVIMFACQALLITYPITVYFYVFVSIQYENQSAWCNNYWPYGASLILKRDIIKATSFEHGSNAICGESSSRPASDPHSLIIIYTIRYVIRLWNHEIFGVFIVEYACWSGATLAACFIRPISAWRDSLIICFNVDANKHRQADPILAIQLPSTKLRWT